MLQQHPSEQRNAALIALIGRPRSVLEVGCGAGINGMVARTAYTRVTGIERDPQLAERARRALDAVHCVDPENADRITAALADQRFDLILMPDILERAQNPEELVRQYANYLEREGRLILSARNAEAWPVRFGVASPEIGYSTMTGQAPALFRRADAVRLAQSAGLEVISVDLNPMLLKSLRNLMSEPFYMSLRSGDEEGTGFRDLSVYDFYLSSVRPLETALARLAPGLLAFQNVVVARRKPEKRPLTLTVGMLTMDEEPSVARMIDEIRRYAPDAQILCIDSSLKDQTPIIAERMGARVLRQLPPRGHGPAMELLMYEAAKQTEALIYLDCDFTYPPSVIPELRAILESGVDVVNATRIRTRPEAMPLPNYLANKSFVMLARLLNGVPVSDLHSGMRAYRSSVIRSFAFDGEGDALPIDTLLWPARLGYHVVEVPIEYQERVGQSKLRKLAGTVWTFIRLKNTWKVGSRRSDTYDVWDNLRRP